VNTVSPSSFLPRSDAKEVSGLTSHKKEISRREFLNRSTKAVSSSVVAALAACTTLQEAPARSRSAGMKFGLVTYQWGKDWDLPTILRHCRQIGIPGVELRTQHAHGVESHLTNRQRYEVKIRFDNSPVTLVGLGTNFAFHSPDPEELQQNIAGAKAYLQLSHDVGGGGVKVKPNALPDGVPPEKTIAQIGQALNELARFGADLGQEVRLEAHGRKTSALPVMKQIMAVADHPNVGICWNCNRVDTEGEGLEHNFNLVKDRLAATVHIHALDREDYPYDLFFGLLKEISYRGWLLFEEGRDTPDRIQGLRDQFGLFRQLLPGPETAVSSR